MEYIGADQNQLAEEVLGFLKNMTARQQLEFWQKFRTKHRERIGNTEAPLCPELLKAVDEQIEMLKPLAAVEV